MCESFEVPRMVHAAIEWGSRGTIGPRLIPWHTRERTGGGRSGQVLLPGAEQEIPSCRLGRPGIDHLPGTSTPGRTGSSTSPADASGSSH